MPDRWVIGRDYPKGVRSLDDYIMDPDKEYRFEVMPIEKKIRQLHTIQTNLLIMLLDKGVLAQSDIPKIVEDGSSADFAIMRDYDEARKVAEETKA